MAHEGLICFGTREGKQHTFVLLEEWVPKAKRLDRDEALAELARRYFTSHGPATLQDFTWWSGLLAADARRGVEAACVKAPHLAPHTSPPRSPFAPRRSSAVRRVRWRTGPQCADPNMAARSIWPMSDRRRISGTGRAG
jgi:hypothetical protein